MTFYRLISRIYPKKLREEFQQILLYNNITTNIDRYLGFIILVGFILGVLIGVLLRIFISVNIFLLIIGCFLIIQGTVYAYLVLSADGRAKFVETVLPDALQLMSANLRAGMTVDKALLLSARPEFGHFKEDINHIGKEIATGKEFGEALMSLTKSIRSNKLKKTFQLIVTGVASGGQLSDLLEHSASNLRQQRLVEQRVRSSVLVYVIFIFSAIGFGAPMLFGLSSFLIEVITDIFSRIEIPTADVASTLPLSFSKVSITPKFVNTYVIISMMITSIMGSLIIGLISKGKEKEGLKYMPLLILLTLILFFTVKFLIGTLLSGLFEI
jgi:archaeal flagellar protein FlaJ